MSVASGAKCIALHAELELFAMIELGEGDTDFV
jgi:hypothetical protein